MRSIRLIAIGLNHKTAPVEIREKFSLSQSKIVVGLDNLSDYEPLQEAVILSTCNRSELYVATEQSKLALDVAESFWLSFVGDINDFEQIRKYTYTFIDEACVHHLLRVAAGLDSLVLGEGQILSQVKHAYTIAKEIGSTSTVLNLLFHGAIKAGKKARTETRISYNAVSVSYAAVELAKKKFGDLSDSQALIIGAGKMAELTAMHLRSQGISQLFVANRHLANAEALAEKFNAKALTLADMFEQLENMHARIDIIVTSTGAPDYVIRLKDIEKYMKNRGGRQLFLIDIAVPRDIEPQVANIENVTLYNIDDLESVIDENLEERRREAILAENIVCEEMEILLDRFNYLPFQPLLAKLSDKVEAIRERELKRALPKLSKMSEVEQRAVENMSKMIVRKLLRIPMMKVTSSAGYPHEQFYIRALTNLFELE